MKQNGNWNIVEKSQLPKFHLFHIFKKYQIKKRCA